MEMKHIKVDRSTIRLNSDFGMLITNQDCFRPKTKLWAGWVRMNVVIGLALVSWAGPVYLINAIAF